MFVKTAFTAIIKKENGKEQYLEEILLKEMVFGIYFVKKKINIFHGIVINTVLKERWDKKMSENIELTELETQICIYKVELTWMNKIKTHIKMPGDNYPKFLQMIYDKFPQITRIKVIETEMIT